MSDLLIFAATDVSVTSMWGLVGLVLGGLTTYITSRSKSSSEIEIAKINSSSSKLEEKTKDLKEELREISDTYNNIRVKYEKAIEKNEDNLEIIKDYENLLRHYRFIFKLAYEMIRPKLEGDSEAIVLLEEVKVMFSENFKL